MAMIDLVIPQLNKPQKMTAQEHAYTRLHHALMVGSIAPGVPVTIRGLAELMQLSPTPVREALRRLSSQNALEVLENRRIIVPKMTQQRLEALVSLRTALELHAAEHALPFVSQVLIDGLEEIDDAMDIAIGAEKPELLIVLNQQFHTKLYDANPKQISMPMIESLWLQLGPFMRIALQFIDSFYPIDRHKEIIAALRQHDLAALKRAIAADIHDAVGRLDETAITKILNRKLKHRSIRETENSTLAVNT